jgi:hypothetical protein
MAEPSSHFQGSPKTRRAVETCSPALSFQRLALGAAVALAVAAGVIKRPRSKVAS